MHVLIFDGETTGAQRNKGNPFDPRNKLCALAYSFAEDRRVLNIEHGDEPYQHKIDKFQAIVDEADLVVGFNLKFDIHWGRRYGISFAKKKVWDCQLYHFIQSNQRHRMPSMNQVAEHWGVPQKIDVVKTEYWDKGLDTDQVPWDILEEYAGWDVDPVNSQIFEKQYAEFRTLPLRRQKLILLHMRDLLVLEDMEFNGALYDTKLSKEMGDVLATDISSIDKQLSVYCPNVPISFNSDEQVSAFLYGGVIKQNVQETFTFVYKDPKKAPIQKQRWVTKEFVLPRIFVPLPNTELQKEGIYSTDKKTLLRIRYKARGFQLEIIDLLLKRSKLEKRKSTYCYGTPKLMEEMAWENNLLHGQLNQSVVVTGRLSSSGPNLQNQDESIRQCFKSRFPIMETIGKWRNNKNESFIS